MEHDCQCTNCLTFANARQGREATRTFQSAMSDPKHSPCCCSQVFYPSPPGSPPPHPSPPFVLEPRSAVSLPLSQPYQLGSRPCFDLFFPTLPSHHLPPLPSPNLSARERWTLLHHCCLWERLSCLLFARLSCHPCALLHAIHPPWQRE